MPSLAWTWTTLYAALQAWPKASGVQYLANLPTQIALGERRLWRELNIEEYDLVDESVSMVPGTREVPKPSGSIQLRTVGIMIGQTESDEGTFKSLDQRSYEYCRMYAPQSSQQARPIYYTELDYGQIYVVPSPDTDYTVVYRYIGALPESLSASTPNATTWLSRAAPDALFAACLMEAEDFLKADDRYADRKTKYYQELLPATRLELRASQRDGDYGPFAPAAVPVS